MVFFTCNHCGESVKKPAVEKHYNFKCRGSAVNVSCMDCLKDFHGDEYVAHTKCISEAQKYSGKDYVAKESKNSGAKKQESWMDIIRSILETEEYKLTAHARLAFQRLQSVDNVPRKKAKFQNFVANCMRMPRGQAEEVWNVLEKELEKMKQAKQAETAAAKAKQEPKAVEETTPTVVVANGKENTHENGVKTKDKTKKKDKSAKRNLEESIVEEAPAKKKSKKQKTNDVEETPAASAVAPVAKIKSKKQKSDNVEDTPAASAVAENDNEGEQQEFAWSEALKKIVDKHSEGIALEKLKKKLLKKYTAKLGLTEAITEKQQKKFEKKFTKNLKKCSELQVKDDVVRSC